MVEYGQEILDEKPIEVDAFVDRFAVVAKFLNEMKFTKDISVKFILPKEEFFDLQYKLHRINDAGPFTPLPTFQLVVEDRIIYFEKKSED